MADTRREPSTISYLQELVLQGLLTHRMLLFTDECNSIEGFSDTPRTFLWKSADRASCLIFGETANSEVQIYSVLIFLYMRIIIKTGRNNSRLLWNVRDRN